MNNSSTPTPDQQPSPQQAPAPQAPIDTKKNIRLGWILLGVAVGITVIGLAFGYILAITAIIAAVAARLGLQAKATALAVCSIVFAVLVVIAFALAVIFK